MAEEKLEKKKIKQYRTWFWLEIIFLLAAVFFTYKLDMNRMGVREIVNVSFDWIGMFALIIILNSCLRGRKTMSSGSFMSLTIQAFFVLFFEVGTWAVDKLPEMRALNYICNIGSNSLLVFSTYWYITFMCESLNIDKDRLRGLFRSLTCMTAIAIAAEFLNIHFGFYYRVDELGVYIRNPLGSIIGFIPFLYILGCGCYLAIKQDITWRKKMDYLSYAIVPLVVSVWYFVTGMPPSLFLSPFIALMVIYGNIYIRQGREMELFVLESAKKDAELAWQRNQLTRSQIKPHFIFNCLGSIEQLCRIDADEARDAVHRFAKYLRVNMDSMSEHSLTSFSNELEHIRNYVWLEQMRFEDDLQYEEEIETTQFYLPPLSIQPIVENAIKHGMMGKEDGMLKVILRVRETEEAYEIEIQDDGNGFDQNQKIQDGRSHIGIQNVRESLDAMVNGEMTIQSKIGEGTLVSIKIPKSGNELNADK
ncbi:MAG: histidine kinase [Clostridiales bacterium]|nr:histidine kinase [Candidatus Blautia equi]